MPSAAVHGMMQAGRVAETRYANEALKGALTPSKAGRHMCQASDGVCGIAGYCIVRDIANWQNAGQHLRVPFIKMKGLGFERIESLANQCTMTQYHTCYGADQVLRRLLERSCCCRSCCCRWLIPTCIFGTCPLCCC